jgi:pyruvate carboxylase
LSESPQFAEACEKAGITFVGPTVQNLNDFSDKTKARALAIAAGVSVVPGTDGPVTDLAQAEAFVAEFGLPVIIKAAMGGGGKGMRVVRQLDDLGAFFAAASSEAKASFGDGSCFIERYVSDPRHIEVQIVGDGVGGAVHLWERDCSVQRRHQKVVEIAPAWNLPPETRRALHADALKLATVAKYKNAGTVEFLVDKEGRHYFIEVNPRIQVEHTVTEEVTGIDLVQTQFLIAAGASLAELGLVQENIHARGVALQCRITTENPERGFAPDTGTLAVYRHAQGAGMRIDGIGYSGMKVTPFYDSLLVKYTARAPSWEMVVRKMRRALLEMHVRGVKTNILFLINVLNHPDFIEGAITTSFIDENPDLVKTTGSKWRTANYQSSHERVYANEKYLRYIAHLAVNGHPKELGANLAALAQVPQAVRHAEVAPPNLAAIAAALRADRAKEGRADASADAPPKWRALLRAQGPAALAAAVRAHPGVLLTDTTWRDAHQSLLATRMRTAELLTSAAGTRAALGNSLFSLEMWGGATFDVSMRFLRECPWERLEQLRALVPDVPFQMLLRGANAVGYTVYPDNVVYKFCQQAFDSGIDIFRVFDSLNYVPNMELGIKAANAAGGFVEAAICYTGDVTDLSAANQYTLAYYLGYAQALVDLGAHALAIKDMAGLLTPRAATMLVGALRAQFPDTLLHVHTHDTAGVGTATYLACAASGADVVDVAIDAMAGMTSQPAMGAVVAALQGSNAGGGADGGGTGVSLAAIQELNRYWEDVRALYLPFESGQLSGSSDVYLHEIPGGQYTNLLFQSKQLGLAGRFSEVKKAYRAANLLLGDIPKVTPSSKTVGDLAQFMVSQNLSPAEVLERAEKLPLPASVVEYFQGALGVPPFGFPEPLRSRVLAGRPLANGAACYAGRPGADLKPYDFDAAAASLRKAYGEGAISDKDVLSHAMYPGVFKDWKTFAAVYGKVAPLPTHVFLNPMEVGDEVAYQDMPGRRTYLKLAGISGINPETGSRDVTFEVNGERWFIATTDDGPAAGSAGSAAAASARRPKADPTAPGDVGSPMPGVIVDVKVHVGMKVREGEPLFTLSAMKMETSIKAPKSGTLAKLTVNPGDSVNADDLLASIV